MRLQPLVPARSPDMKPKRYSVACQEGKVYMKVADESGEGRYYPGFHSLVYRSPRPPGLPKSPICHPRWDDSQTHEMHVRLRG